MSVLGLTSGGIGGLGVLLLLQQFSVLYPTRIAAIVAVVAGAAVGVVAPFVAGRARRGTAAVPAVTGEPAPPPQVVPVAGLQARNEPDPSSPVARDLDAGSNIRVVDQRGDWAQIETGDGWRGWVDARLLEATGA